MASCSFTVTVNDNQPPTISCPSNIVVSTDPGQCTATVSYTVTNSDNCPGQVVTQTAGLPSGSTFPKGITTNSFTVTDASSNTASCSFTITVNDTEKPTMSCPADIVTNVPSVCPVIVNFSASATDNCGLPNLLVTPDTGSAFPVGTNTVTAVAWDSSGNTNVCTFNVVVLPGPAAPTLAISLEGTNAVLSWSDAFPCFQLQYTPQLLPTNFWTNFIGTLTTNGSNVYATNDVGASSRFFRLAH